MASARLKKEKPPAAPPPSQRERALEAIGRMHSFDSFWLEKLADVLLESDSKQDDGSITAFLPVRRLLEAALQFNELRRHPDFPKPWVTT